jgi:hypothetical protein
MINTIINNTPIRHRSDKQIERFEKGKKTKQNQTRARRKQDKEAGKKEE